MVFLISGVDCTSSWKHSKRCVCVCVCACVCVRVCVCVCVHACVLQIVLNGLEALTSVLRGGGEHLDKISMMVEEAHSKFFIGGHLS